MVWLEVFHQKCTWQGNMDSLSIIIPAYNEGEHIDQIVHDAIAAGMSNQSLCGLLSIEVIVVNDGSSDQTLEKLNAIKHPFFKAVSHESNLGYGAALKTGFENARGNVLAFMDGDGTIQGQSIFDLYLKLKTLNMDMVVGQRFGQKGSQMPLIRKLGNHAFAKLLSFLSNQEVKDTASGIRVFRKEILDLLYPLPDGMHFTPAMSSKAAHEKIKILEEPIAYANREGQSKLSVIKDGMRFFRIILSTVLLYNPFKVFFILGMLLMLVASSLMLVPTYNVLSGKQFLFSDYIYRSIGALYFCVCGVQVILFGVLARFIVSTFFKRFETGSYIHRVNDVLKVYDRLGYYGLGVLFIGMLINLAYFSQYLFTGYLDIHWAFLLVAALLVIVGSQMIITSVLFSLIRNVSSSVKK